MKKSISIFLILITSNYYVSQCISGDCVNGHGKYITSWMDKYVGEWKDGVMHGQGVYSFSNGDEYVGNFKEGLRHGHGVYIKVDGEKLSGMWENNQFMGEEKDLGLVFNCISGDCVNGKGESKNIKGDIYVGFFKDGKFHGQGSFLAANGEKYFGDYF